MKTPSQNSGSDITFSEDSSKNKRKRGRPRSVVSDQADNMGRNLKPEGGSRTRINAVYRQAWLQVAWRQEPQTFNKIFGATREELKNGVKNMPAGWETEGESIGRAIVAGAIDGKDALEIVLKAREDRIPAGQIVAHFRKIRLGEKSGNAFSLTMALARALDRYQSQFPATTEKQRLAAIQNLFDLFQRQRTEAVA